MMEKETSFWRHLSMKTPIKVMILLAISLFLAGCGSETAEPLLPTVPRLTEAPATTLPPEAETTCSPEENLLNTMTLREKVGQLFIIRPDALDLSLPQSLVDNSLEGGVTALSDGMRETLSQYPVGGFVHFQKNIVNPDQISSFNQALSGAMEIPPFIAVDEEGGLVARLADNPNFGLPRFDSAAAVGSRGMEAAQEMGSIIGGYLKEYGFHMDFAPVADVNTNPDNPVIGSRSFSSDPQEAALCVRSAADGLRMNGIIPVFKHFPGHGDTAQDSHQQIAVSQKTPQQLQDCEWIPFRQAESRECIMIGHIALPELTGDMTPATFSPMIVSGCLREELGFEGLIITDSLSMGAVIENYSPGEAAVKAFQAGCDILLMPASLTEAFDAMVRAVDEGVISEEALDLAVLRILRFKTDYHLL